MTNDEEPAESRHNTYHHSYRGGAKGNRIESSEKKNFAESPEQHEEESHENIQEEDEEETDQLENANQASDEELLAYAQTGSFVNARSEQQPMIHSFSNNIQPWEFRQHRHSARHIPGNRRRQNIGERLHD